MGLFKRKPKDPDIEAAYQKAYKQERIKVATAKGIRDANRKPFLAQLGGVLSTFEKQSKSPRVRNPDPFAMFFGDPDKPRRRKR